MKKWLWIPLFWLILSLACNLPQALNGQAPGQAPANQTEGPAVSASPGAAVAETAGAATVDPGPPPGMCVAPGSPPDWPPDLPYGQLPDEIRAYLNAGGAPEGLTDRLPAGEGLAESVVQTADLTGSGVQDVFVFAADPNSQALTPAGQLWFFVCQGGRFVQAYTYRPDQEYGGPLLLETQDLNADGSAETVFADVTCGASTCFHKVRILMWNRTSFENRLSGDTSDLPFPETAVVDPDGDAIYDLQVVGTGFGSAGAGPQRARTRTYTLDPARGAWIAGEDVLSPSNLRVHWMHDADAAAQAGNLDEALALFERVAADPALEDSQWLNPVEERAILGAYARFRQMVLYVRSGNEEGYRLAFQALEQEHPPGDPGYGWVELAQEFDAVYPVDGLDSACGSATGFAFSYPDRTTGLLYFGYGNPDYEAFEICP